MSTKQFTGFTLIELIVVIGIIAVLAAIVIIAINPTRQFSLTRNAQRKHDVEQILNAFGQYATDNGGSYPSSISTACASPIIATSAGIDVATNYTATLTPTYITKVPVDPAVGANGSYKVCSAGNNRITVFAPSTELGLAIISVTR